MKRHILLGILKDEGQAEGEDTPNKNKMEKHSSRFTRIDCAKSILNQYEMAFGKLNKELSCIRDQMNGMEVMVEQFKVNNKVYLEIQNIAEDKVKVLLTDNNAAKLLEYALVAVTEALRQDNQRQLLIEKTPPIQNYNFAMEQSPFPIDDYYPNTAKEKVLELAANIFQKLQKGIVDRALTTALGMERGISESYSGKW